MSVRNPLAGVPLRAARWSATHPWRAILAWFVFVLVAVGLAIAVPTQEPTDADYRLGESGRADAMVHDAGLQGADTRERPHHRARRPGHRPAGRRVGGCRDPAGHGRRSTASTPVSEPQWNPDNSALLMEIQLAKDQDDASPLLAVTERVQEEQPGLDIRQAGDITIDESIDERVADDLSSAEKISLPVTLVLMLLAFGALIAAGIPVLIAATSVAATIGITAPLSYLVPAEPTVGSMIVLIGMAVGVDYSLFYLKREREERAKGHGTLDAVEIAAETSGHSILRLRRRGDRLHGGALRDRRRDVQLARHRRDPGRGDRRPRLDHRAAGAAGQARPLGRPPAGPAALAAQPADRAGRHQPPRPAVRSPGTRSSPWSPPARSSLLLALPALGMKLHSGNLQTLPDDIPEVQTFTRMTEEFPIEGTTAAVVVKASGRRPRGRRPRPCPGSRPTRPPRDHFVDTDQEQVQVSDDGTTSVLRLAMPYDESDDRVDTRDRAAAVRPGPGRARRPGRRVRRRRGSRGVARLREPAEGPAAARDRHRAAADPADDGAGVPQRPDRAGLDAAEPGLRRSRVRHPHARVPARVPARVRWTSPARASSSTGSRCS